uniref:Glutaredoxin-like protein n=1 Tax=Sphaeramia orbicularis TaxID=375764 RepID=A0A673BTZ2_9TELE
DSVYQGNHGNACFLLPSAWQCCACFVLRVCPQDPCPLCDDAKQVLEPLRHRFVFEQVDISCPENRVWWDRYRWDIPVFHLNGRWVMKHRVDLDLLDRLLRDAETQHT